MFKHDFTEPAWGQIRRRKAGKGRLLHVSQFDDESLWQGIREGLPVSPITIVRRSAMAVRLNAFRNESGAIVLHLVNYGAASESTGDRKERLPVLLEIPDGRKATSVIVYDPDAAGDQKCQFSQCDGQVFFRLPEMETCMVAKVLLN